MIKGDLQSRRNYRGIKLMSHTTKIFERLESRLRREGTISKQAVASG